MRDADDVTVYHLQFCGPSKALSVRLWPFFNRKKSEFWFDRGLTALTSTVQPKILLDAAASKGNSRS
jgi:hypothetical protein